MDNIKEAYALIDGQKFTAVYNEETGLYEIDGIAPAESSWSQSGHVYNITLVAIDKADNTTTITSTDETYGDQLKLRVLETTAPTTQITSPTTGSVLGSNSVSVSITFSDAGGSGLNSSEAVVKINGSVISNNLITFSDTDANNITATVTLTDVNDGQNTITAYIKDNDGNTSNTSTVSFVVSTTAPNLVLDTPYENAIVNGPSVLFSGYASTALDSITISSVTVKINDGEEETITTTSGPSESSTGHNVKTFNHTVVLPSDGEHTVTIKATDQTGKSTEVVRHITLDTMAPVITQVSLNPHIVNASGSFKLVFKVTDSNE